MGKDDDCRPAPDGRGAFGYLRRSLQQLNRAMAEELVTERLASRPGFWQRLDPRTKLVSTLALILAASISGSPGVLLALLGLTVWLMAASRLPVLRLQGRIWGFIPLITLLAALPATLNLVADGTPLVYLYESAGRGTGWGFFEGPDRIFITVQGCRAALLLTLRVGLSVSLGVLLVSTTPASRLIASLSGMRVPPLLVFIIEMAYRYLVLLLQVSTEMYEARRLRTVGELSGKQKRELVGSSIGALFAKSMALADEVYLAMCARGYTGRAAVGDLPRPAGLDWAFLGLVLLILTTVATGEWLIE